jgi:hypothetical protein
MFSNPYTMDEMFHYIQIHMVFASELLIGPDRTNVPIVNKGIVEIEIYVGHYNPSMG